MAARLYVTRVIRFPADVNAALRDLKAAREQERGAPTSITALVIEACAAFTRKEEKCRQ